jgi:phage terminase large subunit-like protein
VKNYTKIAKQYCLDVISEKTPTSKLTIAACQRQIDDLERQGSPDFPYVFNAELTDSNGIKYYPAERICKFAELMKHTKGEKKGQRFVLEPWQCFFLTTVFGWINVNDNYRRFDEVYAEIPRKNGKSPIGAIIGLYMLTADLEAGAEIYSGASNRDQALEVFKPAWIMARSNNDLKKLYGLTIYGEKPTFGSIVKNDDLSTFQPLVGDPGDGQSVHCYLCDEYHEHRTDNQYSTMKTGTVGRRQSIIAVITTAGTNIAGPCYMLRTQVVNILNKVDGFENDSLFGLIYTLDPGHDWTDISNWPRANPNWGVSVNAEKAEKILRDALQKPSTQNITRTKHLNQWMNVASAFFDMVSLQKCADKKLKFENFKGESCITGVDLASKTDLTASVDVFFEDVGGKKHYYAFTHAYLPERALEGEDSRHYQGWANDGHLEVMPGASINTDIIENDIYDRSKTVDIMEIPHDPWNAATMVGHMEAKGFEMVEINQTVANMSEPTKELESAILDGRFHYDGNPVMTWCLANIVCEYDTNDNVKPKRAKNQNHMKIDCGIALIMAIGRAMVHKPKVQGNDGSLLNLAW